MRQDRRPATGTWWMRGVDGIQWGISTDIPVSGDYDGNGQSDILWHNDNGAVSIWDNGQIGGAHIIANAGRDKSFRRHYGGESIVTNGVNWSFADGHVQWHSAIFARDQLVCCIAYTRVPDERGLIDSHCGR